MAEFNPEEYAKEDDFDPEAYLKEEKDPFAEESLTMRKVGKMATETLPMLGGVAGAALAGGPTLGMASIAGGGLGYGAGKALENYIEQEFFDEPKTTKEMLLDPVLAIPEGAAQEIGSGLLVKGAQKMAPYFVKGEQYLLDQAAKLAENATGATAVQASKFRPGSGKRLMDEGIVRPFDTAENIAEKAFKKIQQQEDIIDSSLKFIDEQGAVVSADDIAAKLQKEVDNLYEDPAKADVARKLENIIQDIYKAGKSLVSTSKAENTKRGFNQIAKNWNDPTQGQAGKIAYRAYRDAVEEAATKANPEIGQAFELAKDTYGFLKPIEEASQRRALQLQQSPFGGLLDITATGIGGIPTGLAVAAGRRAISPRIASTGAYVSQGMSKIPSSISRGLESKAFTIPASGFSNMAQSPLRDMYQAYINKPESLIEKAERINQERKAAKGK